MWFRRCIAGRQVVGSLLCASLVLSLGCAGSPLRLRRKGLSLAENGVEAADQVVQTNVEQNAAAGAGVVTLDSLGGKSAQQNVAVQQPAQAAPPVTQKPLRNFAQIFDNGPKENQLADPFLNSPEPAAQQRPTQTAAAPTRSRTKLENGFDSAMAELAQGQTAPKPSPKPAVDPSFNPFAAIVESGETAETSNSAEISNNTPSPTTEAQKLAAELAASIEQRPAATESNDNPFAAFVGGGAVAATTQSAPKAETPKAPAAPESATADWLRNATAGLPGPKDSPEAAPTPELTSRPAGNSESLEAAARERVRQLLDSAELALRAGRYDDAESIANSAYEVAQNEQLTFGARERTPTALLRRITSAKRLTDGDQSFAATETFAEKPVVEAKPQPKLEVTDTTPDVSGAEAFAGFGGAATWQAVGDDGHDFAAPRTTAAVQPVMDASLWQNADQQSIPAPPTEPASESIAQSASPQSDTSVEWPPSSGTAYQPTSFTKVESTKVEESPALPAPAWNSDSITAPEQPTSVQESIPAWPSTQTKIDSDAAPKLPGLPAFDSESGPAFSEWSTPEWASEDHGEKLAMATVEIAPAPPEPVIARSTPTPGSDVNYGNILALLTVIGLGLVAVIAFRTKPDEIA